MLFTYPLIATDHNWLHDCLSSMTQNVLQATRDGSQPVTWPDCIPSAHRATLKSRTGLKDRLNSLAQAAKMLGPTQLDLALEACFSQNSLPDILNGSKMCCSIDSLPQNFVDAARDFYTFGFKLLSPLGIRDEQYRVIHEAISNKVCPFCGCEYFAAPGGPRHDLDHYLPISRYPFAGANLKNLVPMGDRCNSSYKKAEDILFRSNGDPRTVFDPYGDVIGSVSLLDSTFYDEAGGIAPDWIIDLGEHPAASTWDEVWDIRTRYRNDVFSVDYVSWLSEFGTWCVYAPRFINTDALVLHALEDYAAFLESQKFADRAFLKKAFFVFLISLVCDAEVGSRTARLLREIAAQSWD